jgi:predicted dehydrogenase
MKKKEIRFGVIGCGLMGKEFASAAARWCHLNDVNFQPTIIAVCDPNPASVEWFQDNIPTVSKTYTRYKDLLENTDVDAVYCAVPHHLHGQMYIDTIESKKHLLGEKPFGIDRETNQRILKVIKSNSDVVVRCSSEFPFFPGGLRIAQFVTEERFGKIIEVEAGFWHSSDLNPDKPINWKRQIATNGEYGCMGDLGMHVLHLPLRFGWKPTHLRALLSQIVSERPDNEGKMVSCETWDNAILACDVQTTDQIFPMILSMKRIAPGHANTWFIRIQGTTMSAEYSTKNPKQITLLPYRSGKDQVWHVSDLPYKSAYSTITGDIFEFGFTDSILQMWAAFCDEIVNRDHMLQPFHCVTPSETSFSHQIFTAALESERTAQTIRVEYAEVK